MMGEIEKLVTIKVERYDELLKKEERLKMLEKALRTLYVYNSDFELFKKLYDIDKED